MTAMIPDSLDEDADPWTGHPAGTVPPAPPIPDEGVSPPMVPTGLSEDVDAGDLQPPPIMPEPGITSVTPSTDSTANSSNPTVFHVSGHGLGATAQMFLDGPGAEDWGTNATNVTDTGFDCQVGFGTAGHYIVIAKDSGGAEIARLESGITVT